MKANDVDLIQRTLDGDQDAFTKLVNKYQKWVHALVWRKIGDFHIAEELTQDVFLKVYKRLSTLKRPDHFPSWLYVIATRQCIAWLRKKRLSTKSLDAMSTAQLEELCYTQYERNCSEAVAIEHQRELVKRLLKKLPESERTVVTLYYLAEMSGEEISQFLGVSPNTVRSRLHRARQRLEKEESLIQEVFGSFQLSPDLTENIVREIARIKPAAPSASKPWIPWGLSFASTFLVILMIGTGPRALSRFQQPYNLDATSEMTIELVDTPIVEVLARKSNTRTRFGISDTHGKINSAGFQSETRLLAAAQAEETDLPVAKSQWIQTKGPGGVSSAGLFLASDQTLYAIAKTGLYRLTEAADAWTLVSASGPKREFNRIMAERENTFYLLTPDELLASIDEGKTWHSLGARPKGRAVALIITDTAMYLVLQTEVFRSEDVGQQWEPIGQPLQAHDLPEAVNPEFFISDALAVDNTLFVGTSQGLFRFINQWEKLPVPTSHGIESLAFDGSRFYIGTVVGPSSAPDWNPYAAVFYSTDLGDSWINITPDVNLYASKILYAVEVVAVGDTLMIVGAAGALLSYDRGETWTDHRRTSGASPIVPLDENNFYKTDHDGITRSTDRGITWHPFMPGMVNSHVSSLVTIENDLYALTHTKMFKSADGGASWEPVSLSTDENASLESARAKVVTADGTLYASNSELDGVTIFRLSDAGNLLLLDESVPDFEADTLYEERSKKAKAAIEKGAEMNKVAELLEANYDRILEELRTNGTFTFTDAAVFMEYKRKLFRWRRGETAWHDTGLEDHEGISPIFKGFTLAASGNTVYAGKREGELFLSQDSGDTWSNVTEKLGFPFGHFKEILFADATVYVSTDIAVVRSHNGETWEVVTDIDGNRLIMDRIAVDGIMVYGVCDSGIYEMDTQTNAWKQIIAELPHTAISFAVDSDTFYIGTEQNGVFRFQRDSR